VNRLACVTGRFQPVHEQHLELFELALHDAEHLVVAVTNPDVSARHEETTSGHRHLAEANPFTYFERLQLLRAALHGRGLGDRTSVVPFDLTRPATWHEYVPPDARQFVRAYGAWEREKAGRLADAGYEVTVIDGDPRTRLSASDIRACLHRDRTEWQHLVPPAVVPVLAGLLRDRTGGAR